MNYKTLRLNDVALYAMSSAIYTLKNMIYIDSGRHDFPIFFITTRLGEVRIYKDDLFVYKVVTIANGSSSWSWLIFDYECIKREVFVWL